MLLDGKCPNENWKYNTTLCQKLKVDRPDLDKPPHRPYDYCCELEYPGLSKLFSDTWNKLTDECFAKNDDHVGVAALNGVYFYGVDSILCRLKTISQ